MNSPVALDERPVVVSGVASDAHTWNLVYLQLLVEELGRPVINLGPCVPDELLVERCREVAPTLVVLSSVNGHGYTDGVRMAERLRGCPPLAATPLVIGGNLGTSGTLSRPQVDHLLGAGFDAVFQDSGPGIADFRQFVRAIPEQRTPALDDVLR